jgi:hypothetical protein
MKILQTLEGNRPENIRRPLPLGLSYAFKAPPLKPVGKIARSMQSNGKVHEAGNDDEWDYYIVHDSVGVSHVLRRKKGELPQTRCTNCDD